jgi:hypothetical protein
MDDYELWEISQSILMFFGHCGVCEKYFTGAIEEFNLFTITIMMRTHIFEIPEMKMFDKNKLLYYALKIA